MGLAASGAVLVAFLVPALLRDEPALPVALAATVAIAFVALYLAHGVNMGTTVALAGTLVASPITSALAFAVAAATHLTGLADERRPDAAGDRRGPRPAGPAGRRASWSARSACSTT